MFSQQNRVVSCIRFPTVFQTEKIAICTIRMLAKLWVQKGSSYSSKKSFANWKEMMKVCGKDCGCLKDHLLNPRASKIGPRQGVTFVLKYVWKSFFTIFLTNLGSIVVELIFLTYFTSPIKHGRTRKNFVVCEHFPGFDHACTQYYKSRVL